MTDFCRLSQLLNEAGMDKKRAELFSAMLSEDERLFPTDDQTKYWALERGFLPGRVALYHLNDENFKDYLSDYEYLTLHPLNHHFRIWVNDKLTLKYILNSCGCEDTMPEYYLYVENDGRYTYLMDTPESIAKDENFLFNLLLQKGTLAVKPNSGTSGGIGFMKLEYKEGRIFENNRIISREDFDNIVRQLKNYIVTQYIHQHKSLADIWPMSECTLRVVMVKLPSKTRYEIPQWKCIVSYARFGTSASGGASNLTSGGIGVGFDFDSGKLSDFGIRYMRFCEDGEWKLSRHPDSGVVWKNTSLPLWDMVKSKILTACRHISSLDYLGFDVIITPDSMKFCEINTLPALDYEQVMCGPMLSDDTVKSFFDSKGREKIQTRDLLKMYMSCSKDQ